MFPAAPFDRQVTDTYFVVAHFHYVLVGGAVFPIFAGFFYWLPKMTGRMMDERRGQVSYWLTFIGFNLTFFPMHIAGLLGMPRRIYTYPAGMGWDTLNLLETIGAVIIVLGILVFILNYFWSLRYGEPAGDNPWNASSLEWATSSPPPPYNFAVIPTVRSRTPLWDADTHATLQNGSEPNTVGSTDPTDPYKHETLETSTLDAQPEAILIMPHDTIIPLLLALAITIFFIGILVSQPWLIGAGVLFSAAFILAWLWPTDQRNEVTA